MNAVHTRKTGACRSHPNAADPSYYLEKLTDSILSAAICAGVVTIVLFLITYV